MDMSANTSYAVNSEIARLYKKLRNFLYSDNRDGLMPVDVIMESIDTIAVSATYLLGVRQDMTEAEAEDQANQITRIIPPEEEY